MCSSFCILTYTDCNYPNLIFILQWNFFRIIRHGKYKQSKAQIISLILVLHYVSIIGNKQKNLSLNSKLNHWDIMHRFFKKCFTNVTIIITVSSKTIYILGDNIEFSDCTNFLHHMSIFFSKVHIVANHGFENTSLIVVT